MFSSIQENRRKEVIEKCYWPLLRLASKSNFKISIEATGLTLEIIQALDPSWIVECKKLIQLGKLEFIGSGYSQIIAPLVPGDVNRINLVQGNLTYFELLGSRPKICLVNEMSFSFDLIDVYLDAGYESIIIDANNFSDCELFNYPRPTKLVNIHGSAINVVWADSIAFQQFQRYVHGQIDLDSYFKYIDRYKHVEFPLYSSDAEIFNFRPGRFAEEAIVGTTDEWERVKFIFNSLIEKDFSCYFLSEIVNLRDEETFYQENTDKPPIYVKKQDKYNINRWGLTGISDFRLNTFCYKLRDDLVGIKDSTVIRELLKLWSSDYRTHLSQDRLKEISFIDLKSVSDDSTITKNSSKLHNETKCASLTNTNIYCEFDTERGGSINVLSYKNKKIFGWLPHGYFDNIKLAFDYYSAHVVIEPLGDRKITNLMPVSNFTVSNSNFYCTTVTKNYVFEKEVHLLDSGIRIKKKIIVPHRSKEIIHPLIFTFPPHDWDIDSLYYESSNGGAKPVRRPLKSDLDMTQNYSHLITSKDSIGHTDGIIRIGDKNLEVAFICDMKSSALLPRLKFLKIGKDFLLRLIYSCQEVDDTFRISDDSQKFEIDLKILCREK